MLIFNILDLFHNFDFTKDTASMKELAPGYALYISDFIAKEGMCNKSCYFNIHKDINKYQIEKIKCEF